MIKINNPAPEFKEDALINNEIKKISLSDYKGKWVILFFYPSDFTFICPTELGELADKYDQFSELGAEIISVSTDSVFVHKAWHDSSPLIKKITYPMLSDPTHKITKDYESYIEEKGVSLRATFLINPEGLIKAFEFHDNDIGRSSEELIRKLQAAKFVSENTGNVCPMNWKPGHKTIKPSTELIGKL
ncbi:MAG: redoxin domain-containing protein [Candidatus Pacearchaeota archaeon]|jgi:peroxiredoxin (alkyl hydroperoxide reductase subunit C)